jgi:hypothetical protein
MMKIDGDFLQARYRQHNEQKIEVPRVVYIVAMEKLDSNLPAQNIMIHSELESVSMPSP